MTDTFNISDQTNFRAIFAAGQWGYVSAITDDKVQGFGVYEETEEQNDATNRIVDAAGVRIQDSTDGALNDETFIRTGAAAHRLDQNVIFVWKFLLDDNADVRWFCGLHESQDESPVAADDIGDPAVGLLFSTSRPDANFQFVAHDGAVQTLVDSGIPVDTADHFLKIDADREGTTTVVTLLDTDFRSEASTTFTTEGPGPAVTLNSQEWLRALAAAVKSQSLYYGTAVARGA